MDDLQDISTLLELGAKLEAVKLHKLTTVSFQVLLTFSIVNLPSAQPEREEENDG